MLGRLCVVLLLMGFYTKSQTITPLDVPVKINGGFIDYNNAGGLNNPQFSQADLDNDGDLDLYVFDALSNVHLAFEWDGSLYQLNNGLVQNFPNLNNWTYLRDYNADGATDIFAYSDDNANAGILVYKGKWQNNMLSFDRLIFNGNDLLVYPNINGYYVNVFAASLQYPAVADVDGDLDLDILNFDVGGSYVNLYQNLSVELGYGLDTLIYEKTNECWGGFFESAVSDSVIYADAIGECAFGKNVQIHTNSSLTVFDYNNDNLSDILLGDATRTNISLLVNNGTIETPYITNQFLDYPHYDFSINVDYWPLCFVLDVYNDSKQDLLVSSQHPFGENINSARWYKNVSMVDTAYFEWQQSNFLQDKMIDFGSETHPAFVDINTDGLIDLVVGNYGYYLPGGDRDARLHLLLNIGTPNNPIFELVDDNWLDFASLNAWSLTPTFGDVDNDGDLDLICGSSLGYLYFAENIAGVGNEMEFAPIVEQWMNIHNPDSPIGGNSCPEIADINGDNLPDLLVGNVYGTINYFENIGTENEPFFNSNINQEPNNSFWASIDVKKAGSNQGIAMPYLFTHQNNDFLLVGSNYLGVFLYQVDNLNNGVVSVIDSSLISNKNGFVLHPTVADINNDGMPDLAVGHKRGGLSFYTMDLATALFLPEEKGISFSIFQKEDNLEIESKNIVKEINLFDTNGRLIKQQKCGSYNCSIEVKNLAKGMFFIGAKMDEHVLYKKVVIAQ